MPIRLSYYRRSFSTLDQQILLIIHHERYNSPPTSTIEFNDYLSFRSLNVNINFANFMLKQASRSLTARAGQLKQHSSDITQASFR
ncbi:predicted protein [Sclerotinia sclerotiorum 1980 UF-70]|uniref:Uncharacterized protein n=1 Tax=Sclerotinia sclerotiorum (strain ATCC 18683 / 1980 / Ss-1) TaxID=665079 RepID=A7EFT4_SCLS1|nr:predicted protein [Sclerotinia sclerotiorum 1980 UF-70]EDO01700.1 predicted protein [Sclerotinia sclerotiorum 1980 UF-70]